VLAAAAAVVAAAAGGWGEGVRACVS